MYAGMYYGEVGFGQVPLFLILVSIILANETETIALDVKDRKAIMRLKDMMTIMQTKDF